MIGEPGWWVLHQSRASGRLLNFMGAMSGPVTDEVAFDDPHGENRHRLPLLPQSSSASRFTAGASGFLNLSQSLVRPER